MLKEIPEHCPVFLTPCDFDIREVDADHPLKETATRIELSLFSVCGDLSLRPLLLPIQYRSGFHD